ncbi:MAG: TerC family protein [Ktedonobacteraceae bacterium]
MLVLLSAIGSIILVDLLLSGDNALVIGAAAAGLPRRQRWLAILMGGAFAIILRVAFSLLSTVLLNLPWLQTVGAIILLIIAIRLLADRKNSVPDKATQKTANTHGSGNQRIRQGLVAAMLTILVADITMSLDNILAVGAIANGNVPLLIVGVLISVAILLFGSALIAEVIGRLTWLLDVAALVLAWTGANMILDDLHQSSTIFTYLPWLQLAIPIAAFMVIIVADILLRVRDARKIYAS